MRYLKTHIAGLEPGNLGVEEVEPSFELEMALLLIFLLSPV
jgi:hypothetical protein